MANEGGIVKKKNQLLLFVRFYSHPSSLGRMLSNLSWIYLQGIKARSGSEGILPRLAGLKLDHTSIDLGSWACHSVLLLFLLWFCGQAKETNSH